MKPLRVGISLVLLLCVSLFAQNQSAITTNNVVVPPLVNFNGTLNGVNGKPLSGTVGLTFSLYKDEQGGPPVWVETQNVQADQSGHYTVQLGAASSQGLPADLFSSGEARWLGVQPQGQTEQPRVMLLSVPYAMKAGDAATVGGLPASAFVMANSPNDQSAGKGKSSTGVETQDFIPMFIDSSGDLGNSILYQSGTTAVGIGTTTPAATLEVNGTAKFDNLVTFSSAQTFPGTLIGITAGTGITVGGNKNNPTVGINTTFANEFYPQLGAANTFTKSQTVQGTMTATTFAGNGSSLTNVNAASLNGLASTAFGQLGLSNTYQSSPLGTAIPQVLAPVNNATTAGGFNSNPFDLAASSFNSTAAAAQKELFRWQAEPTGNNTGSPAGTLNLLFGANGVAPTETGLNIASNGVITFASSQTFPGSGTISGVTAGTDLTGGGNSGNVTLNLNLSATDARYAQLGAANNFTGNQAFTANSNTGEVLNVTQSGGGDGINVTDLKGFTGVNAVANDTGVSGTANFTGGGGIGVLGSATSGYGVYGEDMATSLSSIGVFGTSTSTNGYGVFGQVTSTEFYFTSAAGVYGTAATELGVGVLGIATGGGGAGGSFIGASAGSGGSGVGVAGSGGAGTASVAASPGGSFEGGSSSKAAGDGLDGFGGIGGGSSGGVPVAGVLGVTPNSQSGNPPNGPGVFGNDGELSNTSQNYLNNDLGVWGDVSGDGTGITGFAGVLGTADDTVAIIAANTSSTLPALKARNFEKSVNNAPGLVVAVDAIGGQATIGGAGCNGGNYWGLQLGQSGMSNCTNYTMLGDGTNTYINAGSSSNSGSIFFRINNGANAMTVTTSGSVTIPTLDVTKSLTKPAGSFKIDHPLDPANKFLYHSFVESPDMMNIYNGVSLLDANGEAIVILPEYFQALNRDFRYQLTSIGAPGPNLYIAEEIENNQFKIGGGKPGAKVSWQVTGIRQDAFANAYRIQTEVEKTAEERGRYLHPELFGAPDTDRIGYNVPTAPDYPRGDALEVRSTSSAGAHGSGHRIVAPKRPPISILPKHPPVKASRKALSRH